MKIKMHLLGTGTALLLSVYAVTAYAGQEIREQRRSMENLLMPEIRYEEPDSDQGYYKAAPEVRIVHKQAGAVTKYELLSADNSKKAGSLELMEGQDEESVYLAGEDFKEGKNILHVWMEKDPAGPDENETDENGEEGNGTGENESEEGGNEENGTGGTESEGSGAGSAENGSVENFEEDDLPSEHPMQNEAQQQGALQPDPGQTEESLQNHIADESKEYSAPVRPEAPDPVVKADLSEDAASEDNTPEKKPMQPAEPEIVFEKEICFRIDTKKPQKVHFSYNRAILDGSILTNEPVELTLKSTDEGSGMEAICYKTGDGTAGVLTGDSGSIVLNPGFRGQIEAYAVDKAGNQSEPELSAMLLCENQSPEIQIETEGSPDAWRSDPLRVHVKVTDPGLSAGIQCLKCYAGGEIAVHRENEAQTGITSMEDGFTVDIASEGGKGIPVVVEALDWAGNFHSDSRLVYIDKAAPVIQSEGIHDRMIAGEPVKGKMRIREENDLASAGMKVWKVTSGKKREVIEEKKKETEPFSGAQDIEWDIALEEDGTYDIRMTAKDRAGHESRQDRRVIVDQTNPVIRYVDQMQGVYVPYFQWNYGKEEVVQDETDYSYDIFLDGAFYTTGKKITKEGMRMLQVRAVDAAGNESTAEAVFQIDHTPPGIRVYDVEDGGLYEDMAAVSISVDGKGEYLKEIMVNSEKMKLEADCQIFTRSFQEPGDYQIQVRAEDLAGNQEQEQVTFRIEEQKQLSGGVLKPITRIFRNVDRAPARGTQLQDTEQEKSPAVLWLMLCFAMAGGAFLVRQKIWNRRWRS